MLLHSPPIAAGMIELGNGVRRHALLPASLRELVTCRVGQVNRAAYEVAVHREIALTLGESAARLDALSEWESSFLFDPVERASLRFAETLTSSVAADDATFDELRRHLDDRQLVELTVTVAYYNMISRILVALDIAAGPRGS
ncbi:MAG: carboxymuconolactone decarboxylase family protein [Acidimicrobiales bacterium]